MRSLRLPRAVGLPTATVLACAAIVACSDDVSRVDSGGPGEDSGVHVDADAPDAVVPEKDGGPIVLHDGGGPILCGSTCDCPQGRACVQGECRVLGTPVWCCEKEGCPRGQQCLDENDQPDVCAGDPDPVDGGPRVDAGPGNVGDYCEADGDCDPMQGLTCWERFEPPFLWGHCTLEGCSPACPAGTDCIQFNLTPPVIGCMKTCNGEADCRSDAHCFPLPGAPFFGICIPDCRDDFYDCSPRDGTRYCDPATGVFIPDCAIPPAHDPSALIGDACINSTQCATGDICLGEFAWNLDDGMCTRVCSGLPEATGCPAGSTCQFLPPPNQQIGLCFRDCVGGMCPDRSGALCNALDPSWIEPGCIPPAP
jgi:hypothetical protein